MRSNAPALATLLLATLLPAAHGARAEPPDAPFVVVFGDSLTDTGNAFALTGELNVPPYASLDASLIPSVPYAVGDGRFTNGKTWLDHIALRFEHPEIARPALRGSGGGNYAFGGARAGAPLVANGAMHLTDQVDRFLSDVNDDARRVGIAVLFIGGNDVADAVRALAVDPTGFTSVQLLVGGLASIQHNLERLVAAGVTRFVIMNVPNVAMVPALNPPLAPPGLGGIASCWTQLFNGGSPLPPGCPALPPGLPGLDDIAAALDAVDDVDVLSVDVAGFVDLVLTSPEQFDLSGASSACVTPHVPPFRCEAPARTFFWDGIHPTTAVHRLIAAEVFRQTQE
jgi:outer membrane lipase/esterase